MSMLNEVKHKTDEKKVKHLSLSPPIRNNDRTVANRLHGILFLCEWHTAQDEMRIIWIKKEMKKSEANGPLAHNGTRFYTHANGEVYTFRIYSSIKNTVGRARAKHSQNTLGPFERDRHPEIIFHWMTIRTANGHRHERIFSVCESLSEWLNIWRQMGYIRFLCFFFQNFSATNFSMLCARCGMPRRST